jgi:hypothetical protein
MKFLLQRYENINVYESNSSYDVDHHYQNTILGDNKDVIENSLVAIEENINKEDVLESLDEGYLMMLNNKFYDIDWCEYDLRERVGLWMMEDEMFDSLTKYVNISNVDLNGLRGDHLKLVGCVDMEDYFNNKGMNETVKGIRKEFFSSYVEKLKGGYVDPSFGNTMEMFMEELKDYDIEVKSIMEKCLDTNK